MRIDARTCIRRNIARRRIIRRRRGLPVNAYLRRKERTREKKREKESGVGRGRERHESDLRKDGTWEQSINSTAWRVSHPCYSSHKDTTRHSALPRDQIILYWKMCKYSSLAGRVPAFWQLPSYRRALLFSPPPYSFGYEAIFNIRQFYNDENRFNEAAFWRILFCRNPHFRV